MDLVAESRRSPSIRSGTSKPHASAGRGALVEPTPATATRNPACNAGRDAGSSAGGIGWSRKYPSTR